MSKYTNKKKLISLSISSLFSLSLSLSLSLFFFSFSLACCSILSFLNSKQFFLPIITCSPMAFPAPFYSTTFQLQKKKPPTDFQSLFKKEKENVIGWSGGTVNTLDTWKASGELKKSMSIPMLSSFCLSLLLCLIFITMSFSHQEKHK